MKEKVEQIFNCLKRGTEHALIHMMFGIWTRKKHPEQWKEFLKECQTAIEKEEAQP